MFQLFLNSILSLHASIERGFGANHEFGVDHEKDQYDPSYKYKLRGMNFWNV